MKKVLLFLSTPDPYMRCQYWLDEGLRFKKLKNYTEAIQCFDEVLKINTQHPEAWYQKGLALAESDPKNDNEAMTCYNQALSFNPQHKDAWYRKGLLLIKLHENEEAVKCFDQALKIKPTSILILYSKGTSLARLSKYTEAIECYERALMIDPDCKDVLCENGISLNYLGKNAEAIKCFDKTLQVVSNIKKAWQDKGWQGKAFALLNQRQQFDKTETEAWNGKAYALLNQKQFKKAEDCFDKALAKNPHFIYSLQGKGLIAYQKQNFELANEYFRKAEAGISLKDKTFESCLLYYCRGQVFTTFNDLEKAKEAFKKITDLNPNYIPAQRELKKITQLKPNEIPTPKSTTSIHVMQIPSPEPEIEKILAAYHEAENKKIQKSELQNQSSKNQTKLQNSYTPHNPLVSKLWLEGLKLQSSQQYTEAINLFDQALEVDSNDAIVWRSKGESLAKLGRNIEATQCFNEAIRCFNSFLKLNLKDTYNLERKGKVLIELGEHQAALDCFNQVFKIKSNLSPTHMCDLFYFQGKAFVGLNELDKAKKAFNKALVLDPNYDLAKSELRKLQVVDQKSNTTQPQRLEKLAKENHELDEELKKLQAEDEEIEKQLKTRKSVLKPPSQKMKKISSSPKVNEKIVVKPKSLSNPQENLAQLLQETPQESQQHLEEEILILKQQLQNNSRHQKNLEQKIQSLQMASVKAPELANLQKELVDLKNQNAEVQAEREIKAARLAAENKFKAQPNLWVFYRIVRIHLENRFLGAKDIASEFPKLGYTGTLGDIATVTNVGNKLLSLIPAIGNSLDTASSIITAGLEKLDEERMTNILKTIADLGTLTDIKKAAESTARQLTERYSEQLNQLIMESKKPTSTWEKIKEGGKSVYETTKEFVIKEQASSSPKEVAEFAVDQIVSTLLDLSIKPDQPLDAQLIQAVCIPPSRLEKIKYAVTSVLGLNEIETKDGKTWQLQDFYRKPGIRTIGGECYAGEGAEPELYGYRLGTREEAQSLQWQLVPTKKPAKQSELEPQIQEMSKKSVNSYAAVNTQLQQQPMASSAQQQEVEELKQRLKTAEEARVKHENEIRALHLKMNKLLQEQGDKDVSSDVDVGNQVLVKAQSQQSSQRSSHTEFSAGKTTVKIQQHEERLQKLEQLTASLVEETTFSITVQNEDEDTARTELFAQQYSVGKR